MLPPHHSHAAGIDAGSTHFFVATPDGAVTSFESCTPELYRLCDLLVEQKVTTVAMEATEVYWLPLFEILEAAGIEVCLVNGAHVKNLPGRKSDVQDCQWLRELHAHGLLRKSFVPPQDIRALRSYSAGQIPAGRPKRGPEQLSGARRLSPAAEGPRQHGGRDRGDGPQTRRPLLQGDVPWPRLRRRGLEAYEQAYRERQRRYLDKCAAELDLTLVPTHAQST
jgi:hypothetical protein